VRQLDGDRAGADQGHRLPGLQRLHVDAAVLKGPGVVGLGLLRRIARAVFQGAALQADLVELFHRLQVDDPALHAPPERLAPPPPAPNPPGPPRRPGPAVPAAATSPTLPGPGWPPRPSAPAARPAPGASSRPRP